MTSLIYWPIMTPLNLLVDRDVPDLLVDHDVPDLLVGHDVPGGGIVLFAQLQVIQHLRQRNLGTLRICTHKGGFLPENH